MAESADIVASARLTSDLSRINSGDLISYVVTLANSGGKLVSGALLSLSTSPSLGLLSGTTINHISLQV